MAITGLNTTNYGGEVLETALTLAGCEQSDDNSSFQR